MEHTYPIRFTAQLRQHLRSLRKKRGLTQAQVGAIVGVSQARIAEIETNPGVVSFEQLVQLLSALDVTISLSETPSALNEQELTDKGLEANRAKQLKRSMDTYRSTGQIREALEEQMRKVTEAHRALEDIRQNMVELDEQTPQRNDWVHSKKGSW